MYYHANDKLKRKMLIRYISNTYRIKFMACLVSCIMLLALGVFLFVGSVCVFGGSAGTEGMIVGILAGFIFFIIPTAFSMLIWHKTILNLGSPYSEMSKEFIHIEKAGVEFGYHDILNRFGTSMDLYQICFEDIQNMEYDAECMLFTLTGVAQLTVYDDFASERINFSMSQRKFYPDSKYSFLLAFDQAEEIIRKIKEKIGN